MTKRILFILTVIFTTASFTVKSAGVIAVHSVKRLVFRSDSVPPPDVMEVIQAVIYSTDKFSTNGIAELYTPNAVISDDEAPYSWNGPTAGIQWVNSVEMACKDAHLTKFKASIDIVNTFHQNGDNIFVVVPVSYSGLLPNKRKYASKGTFTFVLRLTNGKWLIKSQAWMPGKSV